MNNRLYKANSELISLLQDLMKIKSFSKQEGAIQDKESIVSRVYKELRCLKNLEVYTQDVGTNSQNVIACLSGNKCTENANTLIITAHLDTVPPGPQEKWHNKNPFSGEKGVVKYLGSGEVSLNIDNNEYQLIIRDEMAKMWEKRDRHTASVIYGRGAFDNKASVAILLTVLKILDKKLENGWALSGHLIVVFNVDEELDGSGIKNFVGWGKETSWLDKNFPRSLRANVYGIVMEGSYGFIPMVGHKGIAWYKIVTEGKSAHASTPQLGTNAVIDMCKILCYLDECRNSLLSKKFTSVMEDQLLGEPTMAIGTTIFGGGIENLRSGDDLKSFARSNINAVPEYCQATLDLRIVRGTGHPDDADEVPLKLKEILEREIRKDVSIGGKFSISFDKEAHFYPSAITNSYEDALRHPLVENCLEISKQIQAIDPWIVIAPGATDAGFIEHGLGAEVLAEFGPAGGLSHEVHEYVEVEQLNIGVEIILRIIKEILVQ